MKICGNPMFSGLNCLLTFSQETIRVNPVIPHFLILLSHLERPKSPCHHSSTELAFPRYGVCSLISSNLLTGKPFKCALCKAPSVNSKLLICSNSALNVPFILFLLLKPGYSMNTSLPYSSSKEFFGLSRTSLLIMCPPFPAHTFSIISSHSHLLF